MSEQFTFHGTTTFINRPRDTVIRDFQNTYLKGDGSRADQINTELARLVGALLQSRELSDAEREETVAAVHSVAEQVRDEKANRLTLKGTLQAVQDIVAKAADVAGPAAAIIATVLQLAGLA